jgi:hypothetical protein
MQRIASGPSRERIVRHLLVTLLVTAFSVAFLLDGFGGYAENNVRQLVKSLGLPADHLPRHDQELTVAAAAAHRKNLTGGMTAGAVTEMLGEPAIRHGDAWYYLGPGGHLRADFAEGQAGRETGRLESATWVAGVHTETDIRLQKLIGFGLAAPAIVLIFVFVRVVTRRTVLDDRGLQVPGRPIIPWETITDLGAAGDRDSLSVELTHVASGAPAPLYLERYDVVRLADFVDAICEKRGFPNPLSETPDELQDVLPQEPSRDPPEELPKA